VSKRKPKPLTPHAPRAREIVTLVINAAALGSYRTDGQLGAVADKLGMTRGRLRALLARSEGWLTVENGFLVPTVAAIRWQDPTNKEPKAAALRRKLAALATAAD